MVSITPWTFASTAAKIWWSGHAKAITLPKGSPHMNGKETLAGRGPALQEVVEAQGHLVDSHIMEQIFDTVVEFRGRFDVEQFHIGRTNAERSEEHTSELQSHSFIS